MLLAGGFSIVAGIAYIILSAGNAPRLMPLVIYTVTGGIEFVIQAWLLARRGLLQQAVLLLAYEWLKAVDTTPAVRTRDHIGVPATRGELMGLFEHLERELDAARFFFPPAKKDAMVRNIRAMILSSRLTDQQARTIRGMIVALVRNKYRGKKT